MFLFRLVTFAASCSSLNSDATWFPNVVKASGVGSTSTFAAICFNTSSFCSSTSGTDLDLRFIPLVLDCTTFVLAIDGESKHSTGEEVHDVGVGVLGIDSVDCRSLSDSVSRSPSRSPSSWSSMLSCTLGGKSSWRKGKTTVVSVNSCI